MEAAADLIDRSALSEECKASYKGHVRDAARALGYSVAATR